MTMEKHEVLGRVGAIWHILPHNGTSGLNETDTACGETITADELGHDADGAEHLVRRDRTERGGLDRKLCEACRVAPARARGLELWNRRPTTADIPPEGA